MLVDSTNLIYRRINRWDIKFNGLTTSIEKMAMMNEKIKETETLLRDRTERNQTLEKLELTEKLLRLKEKLNNLEKQETERKKREKGRFDKHSESYGQIDENYKDRIKNKKIDRNISEAIRRGDKKHAEEMVRRQIELGRLRAKQADEEYKRRHREAMEDGKMSDKEQKDLDRIKENKRKARAREEKYGDKLNESQNQKSVNQTVGSFNAAILAIMGGGSSSPAERTAKATEKQVKVLKKVEKNTKTNKQLTY